MSKYAIYYIIDDTLIPSIDWFFRFTLQNPFTILFDGEPFMKITDPQHIARITELLLTQN